MSNRIFLTRALSRRGGVTIPTRSRTALSASVGSRGVPVPEWSHTLSFAQAESDSTASDRLKRSASSRPVGPIWSGALSFASAESDFTAEQMLVSAPQTALGAVHSNEILSRDAIHQKEQHATQLRQQSHLDVLWTQSQYLVSSPESAVGVVHAGELLPANEGNSERATNHTQSQLDSLLSESQHLFPSPESALGVVHAGGLLPSNEGNTERAIERTQSQLESQLFESQHMFPSPESALGVVHAGEMMERSEKSSAYSDSSFHELSAETTLFTSPESATGVVCFTEMLDDSLKKAWMEHLAAKDALPKTLSEALSDERPIVITSVASPFDVIDVNGAWEGLCGYSREEALHRNIGELLQGPETNTATATEMVRYLKRDKFSTAVLTNYTKGGRKFRNRITVGVISSDGDEHNGVYGSSGLYFVGVLEDLEAAGNKMLSTA